MKEKTFYGVYSSLCRRFVACSVGFLPPEIYHCACFPSYIFIIYFYILPFIIISFLFRMKLRIFRNKTPQDNSKKKRYGGG